ncbi:MAG: cobalamin B12-binding domain-containing protein [Candidatus Helarchaeota archaeon]
MSELTKAAVELEEDQVLNLVKDRLAKNSDEGLQIVEELREAMNIIGKRFEEQEYFLSDLVFAAEIFENAIKIIRPYLKTETQKLGKVLIGTVQGDIHDIGKSILGSLLECAGFEVIDLGVDQPIQNFIEAIKKENPDIIGLSTLLTIGFDSMKKTIEEIRKVTEKKIIIGGGVINQDWCDQVKADLWAKDAMDGVNKIRELLDV